MGCSLVNCEDLNSGQKPTEEQMVSCLVLQGSQLKNLKDGA